MSITDRFNEKKILIWGYGREGKTTESFLKTYCNEVKLDIFEGKREGFNIEEYDYVFKSPGIVCEEENEKLTSETQVFLEAFGDRTIGITGTKGKSTTSALLFHVLNKCLPDKKVILLGNIGDPCLNYYGDIDDDTIIVFEMSCHQLCHVTYSPHIAVFLNLFEEHLDYYKTLDKYFFAKSKIARFQNDKDYYFHGDNVPNIDTSAREVVIDMNAQYDYELSILGEHNKFNAEFVFRIANEIYNISANDIRTAMKSFMGLKHRLEYIGSKDGVDYYDDSISTIPAAAISALNSLKSAQTILIGGMDRGIDYSQLIKYIDAHNEFIYILMYESGKRIWEQLTRVDNVYLCSDLENAVKLAKEKTDTGRSCVLSPAAASYGYFKNFEERGECFSNLVLS